MGEQTAGAIKAEFEHRMQVGEFLGVAQRPGTPGHAFTTQEMIDLERATTAIMRAGQRVHAPLSGGTERDIALGHPHLNTDQQTAVAQVMASRDRILALEGVAGGGKTTALTAVRALAEREGYRVEGLAPTSRATQTLGE